MVELGLVAACSSFDTLIPLAVASGLLFLAFLEPAIRLLGTAIRRQPWWSRAREPQKTIMVSFGYSRSPSRHFPSGITERMASEVFAWTVIMCIHHTVAGIMLAPVNLLGWTEAGSGGREAFVTGMLLAIGFGAPGWWGCAKLVQTWEISSVPPSSCSSQAG